MHFDGVLRLMSMKGLEKRTTFELAEEFAAVQRTLDELVRGPAWWSPKRFWRDTWIKKTTARSAHYTAALVERYRGLFFQMYNGLCLRGGTPDRTFVEFFETWWDQVEDPIMGAATGNEVSLVFWNAAEFAANVTFGPRDSSTSLLRPKFMLRPLVDEIRDRHKRTVLLAMAYDTRTSSAVDALSSQEQYRVAAAACEALFDVLSARGRRAETLTNGAVAASLLNDKTGAVRQLRRWLFGAW